MVFSEKMKNVADLVRPNVLRLKPYRCARDDYASGILLDANENPHGPCIQFPSASHLGSHQELQLKKNAVDLNDASSIHDLALHRYPDPYQRDLKQRIIALRQLPSINHVFTGVGSDEAIDLLMRVFGRPGKDAILICPPTYGMYTVSAEVNDLTVVRVPLLSDFHCDPASILEAIRTYEAEHQGSRVK